MLMFINCFVLVQLYLVFKLAGMVYLFSDAVKCDEQGKFGWRCRFTCNCKDGVECEKETGYCENGCVEGYYGTGCQFSEYYNEL